MKPNRYLDPAISVYPDKNKEREFFNYLSYAIEIVENLLRNQNNDGSWGKQGDIFNQVYLTTQVLQCLFRAGFTPEEKRIRKALEFLDNVKEPHIDYRAIYYLYAAMGRLRSNDDIDMFLVSILNEQKEDGSLLFQQEMKGKKEIGPGPWEAKKIHRGREIFHALHELHMISLIDYEDYTNARKLIKKLIKFLTMEEERVNKNSNFHILLDGDGMVDPQFTSWWLCLRIRYGIETEYLEDTIDWILNTQYDGGWREDIKNMGKRIFLSSFVIIDLCYLDEKIKSENKIKISIKRGIDWLIKNHEYWKNHINFSSIAGRAILDGISVYYPNEFPDIYNMSIYFHLKEKMKLKRKIKIFKLLFVLFLFTSVILGIFRFSTFDGAISLSKKFIFNFDRIIGLFVSIFAAIAICNKYKTGIKSRIAKIGGVP